MMTVYYFQKYHNIAGKPTNLFYISITARYIVNFSKPISLFSTSISLITSPPNFLNILNDTGFVSLV